MKPKVMVIGLDGATLTLIRPLARKGVLPNLASLLQGGVSGILKSSVPPYTPPAWTSFYTGVNPGKHGIYGFTWLNPETKDWELPSSKIIGAKKLWHLLNEHGLRTGLINLPLTYPPEEVEGFMVSGMMTPENAGLFTYPESIATELRSQDNPYMIDIPVLPIPDAANTNVVKKLQLALKGRREACLRLMESHPCDLMMAVFVTPDRLQHVYWKYVDENSELYDSPEGEEFRSEILACYQSLDEIIGDILTQVGDESQVFVMSDHGFCDLRSEFFFNNWLSQEGFLTMASSNRWMVGGGRRIRAMVPRRLLGLLSSNLGNQAKEKGFKRAVDWERTVAYAHEQGLYIHSQGLNHAGSRSATEEYGEIRNIIAERLRQYINPFTGLELVNSIIFKEDVFNGPYFEMAPDIVAVLDNYSSWIYDGFMRSEVIVDRSGIPNGIHHADGMFIAYGPHVKKGTTIDGAEIIDVTPTILHALGLPIPDHMDGKVLADIFEKSFLDNNPIRSSAGEDGKYREHVDVYSQDEADEIQEQLRGMGYLS